MYIDSHVHYAHKRFDNIRKTLLPQLHEAGLEAAVEAAISIDSNKNMQTLLQEYPWIFYSVGLHPNRVNEDASLDKAWEQEILEALEHPKVVAIGETGLDYHRLRWETSQEKAASEYYKERQKLWFHRLIQLAKEKDMPLIIHTRDAHEDTLRILRQYDWGERPGVIHCFRGNIEEARAYVDLGFVLGIGGAVSFDTEEMTREALKELPLSNLILETDSPFLVPIGVLESRNTSANIPRIADLIGNLKGLGADKIMRKTAEKTKELFGLYGRIGNA